MKEFAAYRDVRIILDTALANNQWPLEYALSSQKEAITWRFRAHRLRSEIRKYDKRLNEKPVGESPYDEIVFIVEGSAVIIDIRVPTGTLTHAGKKIEPVINDEEPDDEDDFELGDI